MKDSETIHTNMCTTNNRCSNISQNCRNGDMPFSLVIVLSGAWYYTCKNSDTACMQTGLWNILCMVHTELSLPVTNHESGMVSWYTHSHWTQKHKEFLFSWYLSSVAFLSLNFISSLILGYWWMPESFHQSPPCVASLPANIILSLQPCSQHVIEEGWWVLYFI